MMADVVVEVTTTAQNIAITAQSGGIPYPVLYGTGSPPDPTYLAEGTLYFQII
jgi:hypothetical protein